MSGDFIEDGLGLVAQGKPQPPETPAPATAPSYPIVSPHPAPDGSGAMINMSDSDWVKFQAGQAAAPVATKSTAAIDASSPPPAASSKATPEPDFDIATALGQVADGTFKSNLPPPPPERPQTTVRGVARNAAAGLTDIGAGTINTAISPSGNLIGKPLATALVFAHDALAPYLPTVTVDPGVWGMPHIDWSKHPDKYPDDVRQMLLGDTVPQPGTRAINTIADVVGTPHPNDVTGTPNEQLVRKAVGAAGMAAGLGGPGAIAPVLGASSAIVGDIAGRNAPDWAAPAAELAGNFAGGAGTGYGIRAVGATGRFATQQTGFSRPRWLGGAPKETIGGVTATAPRINAVANQVSDALGPEGAQLLRDRIQNEQSARTAEAVLAENPNASDFQAKLDQINAAGAGPGGRLQLVPGSNPTTAQVAPTPGMLRLDKATRVAGGGEHESQAIANNTAQISAIKGLQPEGNPGEVGQLLTQRLAEIDQAGDANIAAAKFSIAQRIRGLSIRGTPDSRGEALREALDSNKQAERNRQDRIFKAIDPNEDLALDVAPQMQAANAVRNQFDMRDWGNVDPTLRNWTERLGRSNGVEFFSRFRQNLSDLSADIRTLRGQGLDSASNTLRLLNQLKQGMQQSLVEAGQRQGEAEQAAVAAGTLPPEQTLYARLKAERDSWLGEQQQTPGETPPVANWTQTATDRYNAAREGYSQFKQTYSTGAVGRTLQPGANGEDFRVESAKVPNQFLTGNETEPSRVQKFSDAVNADPAAMGELRNAFVAELQDKGIIRDGEVNAAKLAEWQRVRQGTIDKFSDLGDQISDLGRVQGVVDEARAAQAAATKGAQAGALGYFIKDDPMTAVRKALSKDNPTENMRQLIQTIRGSTAEPAVKAAAEAGLRRAVVEYLVDQAQSSQPAGTTGYNYIKKASAQDLINDNKEPLKVLFGGQGFQTLNMVAADIRRSQQAPLGTGGSDTMANAIQDTHVNSGSKAFGDKLSGKLSGKELVEAGVHGVARSALSILGVMLGEMLGEGMGLVGGFALPGLMDVVKVLRQSGIKTQTQLRTAAMLNPELALQLNDRIQANKDLTVMQKERFNAAIRAAVVAPQAVDTRN